jgi:hypothetical protein
MHSGETGEKLLRLRDETVTFPTKHSTRDGEKARAAAGFIFLVPPFIRMKRTDKCAVGRKK